MSLCSCIFPRPVSSAFQGISFRIDKNLLLAASKTLICLDFSKSYNYTPTRKTHDGSHGFLRIIVDFLRFLLLLFLVALAGKRQTNVQTGVSGRQALFFSWPRSMMSPKLRALYSPTLLAWRTMRSGRGLLSSVDSRTMCTLSATSTPFSFLVVSTCR